MPQQHVARLAFNRGQVSPLALARTDIDRVELSAEVMTNFMPRVLGSMMNRPGWKYVDTTLSNNYAQHLPFVFSLEDKALIEFTNNSMRVRVDDEVVMRSAVSTTTRGGDFGSDVTNFNKISDPGTLPSAGGVENWCVFSPDGQFYVHCDATEVRIYYISGTTFTVCTTLAIAGTGAAFSPDNQLLAVTSGTNVRFYYPVGSGASTTWTQIANSPIVTGLSTRGIHFSPDGTKVAFAYVVTSPYCDVYSISGTGNSASFTQLTGGDAGEFCNAADYPAGNGRDVKFSWDSRFMAVTHDTTPFVTIYSVNGNTFTKIANPASLPAGNAWSSSWSRDGNWFAVAHATTPFITIYAVSGSTFTKQTNPASLPASTGFTCDFSSDNQFLAVAHTTTPFVTIYRNVSGTWTKQTNPATLPDGNATGVAFSPNNRFLGVNHATSQFITLYECYQWLDLDETGTSSTYGGVAPASYQTAFDPTISASWGIATVVAGATVRQIIEASQFTRTGDKVKITFKAGAGAFGIDKCYIGKQASSGDVYDFASAPTQVTFSSGSAGFSLAASGTITSDEIVFDFDGSDIVVAFHITSNTVDQPASNAASSSALTPYYKNGADDSSTVNTTGYTVVSKDVVGVDKIEVLDTATGGSGLYFIGTLYNQAKRVQAVSVLNSDKTVEHALNIIVDQGVVELKVGTTYGADDLVTKATLTEGYHSLAFTPNSNLFFIQFASNTLYSSILSQCQVAGSGDMTLNTVYEDADIGHLRYAQSADVVYLACPGKPPYKIERRGTTSWSFVKYLPSDGPFRSLNSDATTLTASALSGDITVTASRDTFKSAHVGSIFKITSAGQNTSDNFTGANQFSATNIRVTGVGTARSITIVRSGTWSATITLQRSASAPGNWVDVATFTTNGTSVYTDDLDNQIYYYRIGIKTGNYTSGTATVQLQYASGGIDGVVRITGYTSKTSVSAIVLKFLGSTSASENWKEGLWSDVRGYPTAVALHEGRIVWAGKDRAVLSVSDAYESFDEETEGDSGPINRTIGLGPVDQINWIVSSKTLVLGGQDAEFSVGTTSFDEVLTPSNFHADPVTNVGSSEVMAVKLDKAIIFASRTGTKLYQLSYDSEIYDYAIKDLSRLVPELCEAQIVKLFYQRYPDTRVHCVLNDGTVAVMVYEQEEQVNCWLKVETDGFIEDCVVLPGDIGTPEDQVYYVVRRTINGATVRYLERWALESECVGGTLNCQLDSYITYSGVATTAITGLDHLEGETVRVWGDGAYKGSYVVSSGAITVSSAVSAAVVGLPYESRFKSTKLAYAARLGTALTMNKKVSQFGVICQNTHNGDTVNQRGPRFGTDFDYCYNLPSEIEGVFVGADYIHDQADLDFWTVSDKWGTDSRLCIIVDAPYPITLLCITFSIDTNG